MQKYVGLNRFPRLYTLIGAFGKPVICAANGDVLAGAFSLALACDLVIAKESARFGSPEINVGAFPFMISALIYRSVASVLGAVRARWLVVPVILDDGMSLFLWTRQTTPSAGATGGCSTAAGRRPRSCSSEIMMATVCRPDDPVERVASSDGQPVPGVEIRIVGPDDRPVCPGADDEIRYCGPGRLLEYWRNPEVDRRRHRRRRLVANRRPRPPRPMPSLELCRHADGVTRT